MEALQIVFRNRSDVISGGGGLGGCRAHFPALNDPQSIICDGAAGSQVIVIISLSQRFQNNKTHQTFH